MAARTKRHPLRTWRGPERSYDLITEGTIAVIVVALLCVLAASLWGSPDGGLTYPGGPKSPAGEAFSARYWDTNDPSDLAQTAVQELAGGTTTAGYGPPFNQTTGASQEIIGIKPAEIAKFIFGLTLPINTANDFVLAPVSQLAAPSSPAVAAAVSRYKILFGFLLPMFAPWIPIVNRIPRWIPLYKIIYRKYYASMAGGPPPAEVPGEPAPPPPAPRD